MSYETNPILNRIKFSKGWKTSSFPTKILNYSRDMRLWFKIYLFLKVYLLLYGFRLLTCEIRISNNYTKLAYLSVTRKLKKKKKPKSKWKKKSFLKSLNSPLTFMRNKKGRFLLYLDLQALKKKFLIYAHVIKKKFLSSTWTTKPRMYSWINSSYFINRQRILYKLKNQTIWKRKNFLFSRNTFQKKFRVLEILPKAFFYHSPNKNKSFWKKKQRNIFSLLMKIKKDLFLFEIHFKFILSQLILSKNIPEKSMIQHLLQQFDNKKHFLNRAHQLYNLCKKKAFNDKKDETNKNFQLHLKKNKLKFQQYSFLLNREKQFRFLQRHIFFLSPFNKRIFLWDEQYFLNWNNKLILTNHILKYSQGIQNFSRLSTHLPFTSKIFPYKNDPKTKTQTDNLKKNVHKSKYFIKQNVNSSTDDFSRKQPDYFLNFVLKKQQQNIALLHQISKIKNFKRLQKITPAKLFSWLRFEQKIKVFLRYKKKRKKSKRKNYLKKEQSFYKFSFRRNYRTFLKFSTNMKLKYLLQDLIQQYFSFQVHVKLSWPLTQFKNLKYYRLVFQRYKHRTNKKKIFPLQILKPNAYKRKKYTYIGKTTNHLKYTPNFLAISRYDFQSLRKKKINPSALQAENDFPNNKKTAIRHNLNKYMEKKNIYLIGKAKNLYIKRQKRLSWTWKSHFLSSSLMTTLTLFVKYLDPQPLADHLAEIIKTTKRHASALEFVELILRTFPLERALGYRIALIGRVNGSKKSRTIYLRKLNRNRSRQNFSQTVNFALAQVKAKIGTFAVKIWVYS